MQIRGLFISLIFVLFSLGTALAFDAQEVPPELEGDWGTPEQCQAQAEAGADETVAHITDAPYRFSNIWMSRWFFYCRVLSIDPLREDGFRMLGLCGEDATERPWEIDIVTGEDETISMTWYAMGEAWGASRPWSVGPLQRCETPGS